MKNTADFIVGKCYSTSAIWNILEVPEVDCTPEWQNNIYDFLGTCYVLCQAYGGSEGIFSECKHHLGEMYCYGKQGATLRPEMARALTFGKKTFKIFFRKSKLRDYVYLGHGKFRGLSELTSTSPLFIHWAIDSGDRLLPLREHIDAFRRFCAFSIN